MNDECYKYETELFSNVPMQTIVEEGSWDRIAPLSGFETGTLEFNIAPTDEYIDLSETQLYLSCSIRKKVNDKYDLLDSDKVGPINNFLHSLFSQVTLWLNNTQIENSNGSYAYRAYIENLLNYGKGAKTSHLRSCLFEKDTPGYMEVFAKPKEEDIFGAKKDITYEWLTEAINKYESRIIDKVSAPKYNAGFLNRTKKFQKKTVELYGPLHIDMFNSNKYLLNQVPVRLQLQRSKDSFSLMGAPGTDSYIVHIDKAFLHVRKVKLSPNIMNMHIKSLQSMNAYYPIRRVIVKTISISEKKMYETLDKIHIGRMPRRVVVGFVKHSAVSGNFTQNPFNFEHFNLERIQLNVAGHSIPYRHAIDLDFNEDDYILGYSSIYKGLNKGIYLTGNDISYDEFKQGYALFAFNLTPDHCDGEHMSIPKTGELQIDVKFKQELATNISAIVYLEFDSVVQINNLRQVFVDYKP